MRAQARALLGIGAKAVLIKGGHAQSADATDLLVTPTAVARLHRGEDRYREHARHRLHALVRDRGRPRQRPALAEAVADAKAYVTAAIAAADELAIGKGHGPMHHFHAWW